MSEHKCPDQFAQLGNCSYGSSSQIPRVIWSDNCLSELFRKDQQWASLGSGEQLLRSRTFSTPHSPESLTIRFTDRSGVSLVCTADTGYLEELAGFARGADLLMLEYSFWQDSPTAKHLDLPDAMRVAQLASPQRLLLTHFYPEWDGVDIEAEAKKLWPGEVIEACDGLRVEI
jgi:ribonuclease BN (tRNA processing enzyme)